MTQEPSYTESGYITEETANSFYSLLPPTANSTLTHYFHIAIAGKERAMISKQGKPRPSTHVLERPSSATTDAH